MTFLRSGLDATAAPAPPSSAAEAGPVGRHAGAVAEESNRTALRLLPYCLITAGFVGPINCLLAPAATARGAALALAVCNEAIVLAGLIFCLWCRIGAGRPTPGAQRAQAALRRYRRNRRAVVLIAAGMGGVWFLLPILLFPTAGITGQLMIACTCAGMICTSLALVPIPSAQRALALPLIGGSFLALALTRDQHLLPLAVLLAIYGLFVIGAAQQLGRLLTRYTLLRLQHLEQASTVQLLLGHADTPDGSLLWESGADGRLRYVSHALAQGLGMRTRQLEGMPLLGLVAPAEVADEGARHRLDTCLTERVAFRNLAVPVITQGAAVHDPGVPETVRYWSFTGRPVFDGNAEFLGFRGVATDITETREAGRRASYRARHDSLTGLLNRHGFSEHLRQALHEMGRRGTPFALLSLDLDGFKAINDSFGHAAGDRLLKGVAARLREGGGAQLVLGRQGGDEFLGLIADAEVGEVDRMSRRLLDALSQPFRINGVELQVGASIGVAFAPLAGDTGEALLEAADLALYRAKRDGGGTACFYEPKLRHLAQEGRALLADLRRAVSRREFRLVYQPIVDTQTLELRGFEALLRWYRPGYGFVAPDRFVRVAEEAGLIGELGAWVLERACEQAISWPDRLRIAVNVSVSQLETPGFAGHVADVLKRTGVAVSRLELEITESIFMDADASSFGVLQGLRDLGVHVALDDFGCGFSSLGFLRGFTFSKLKMDAGFVREMSLDRRALAVVSAIVNLGAELGMVVTAEGVETPQQLAMLRQMGCTEAQGFLFSRPLEPVAVAGLLARLDATGGMIEISDDEPPGPSVSQADPGFEPSPSPVGIQPD